MYSIIYFKLSSEICVDSKTGTKHYESEHWDTFQLVTVSFKGCCDCQIEHSESVQNL